jgi:hypothetical protein
MATGLAQEGDVPSIVVRSPGATAVACAAAVGPTIPASTAHPAIATAVRDGRTAM